MYLTVKARCSIPSVKERIRGREGRQEKESKEERMLLFSVPFPFDLFILFLLKWGNLIYTGL